MSTEAIRWGLMGTSRINEKLMRGANGTDAADIVAVGSRSAATGEAYAAAHGIPKAHASYEALLADHDRVVEAVRAFGGNVVLTSPDHASGTDRLAEILLTPSQDGDENLLAEGVPAEKIDLIGNIMIDSFEMLRDKIEAANTAADLGLEPCRGEPDPEIIRRVAPVLALAGILDQDGKALADLFFQLAQAHAPEHGVQLARAGAQGFLNQVNVANAQLERFVVTRHDPLLRGKGNLFSIRRI